MNKISFSSINEFLRKQENVVDNIREKKFLRKYFVESNLAIILCSAVYGAVLGIYPGGFQILLDLVKVPILFLLTLYIVLPVFYIIDVLLKGEIEISQTATLLLTGFAVTSVVLITFTPVVLFFIITAPDYYFIVLLNICVCGLAGYFGLLYIMRGFQIYHKDKGYKPSVFVGSIITAFVGTQLAWTLRPFFHNYGEFVRPPESNFYVAVASLIAEKPYIGGAFVIVFALIAFVVTIIHLSKPSEPTPVMIPPLPPGMYPPPPPSGPPPV